jgi:hypothetical protein
MKTLEAVNQVLLLAGERQVRDISSPPALKAKICLSDALLEFSLLGSWPGLTEWVFPVGWADTTATLPSNTIKILGARVKKDGVVRQWSFKEEWVNSYRDETFTVIGKNKVLVEKEEPLLQFKVTRYVSLPENDSIEIDIDETYLAAVLKRALAMFVLVHLEDVNKASQHTAEYEALLTQLRLRERQTKNGFSTMYRNSR